MEFTALKWKRKNYDVTIFSVFKIAIANNRFSKKSEFEFYESENNVKLVFCHTHFLAIFSGYQLRFSLNIS